MSKGSFMQGALILFIAGIFIKVIGFVFQILVIRIAGTEAVGVFNMVFPLYITILVLSTAGLPLAISKMVSREMALNNYQGALKIFKISLYILIASSFIFTILLIITAPYILDIFYSDPRIDWCFYGMLPGIFIVSICSAFRGFFQGLQNMFPPAITQCIEQIIRISLGITLIIKLKPYGIKAIAFGLSIGMILGELVGLLVIYIFYKFNKQGLKQTYKNYVQKTSKSLKGIIYELFSFGLPTTLTRLASSLVLTLEASLIPITLQKNGYTINQAASIYGQFSGVAITLLTIPTVLTFSLATSLVPAISEAEAKGKLSTLQFRTTEALRITYIFGLPITIVLFLKASSLSQLLFNLPEAGTTLRYLSLGALFLYLAQTSNGILQGLGLVNKVLLNTLIGAVIKLLGVIFLVPIPELNINGAAIAFVFSYIVVCILNLYNIYSISGFTLSFSQITLPIIASLIMTGILIKITKIFLLFYDNNLTTFFSLLISGIIYLFLIIIFGQLNIKDIIKKNKD